MTVATSMRFDGMPLLERAAEAAFYGVRARGAVVLAFHEIDPAKFERWVRLLRREFELVSLDELVRRRTCGERLAGLLALTFDDGWATTCEPVAALCDREGWPVTIYLVSRACGEAETLWFAELPALLDAARGRRIESDGWVLDLTGEGEARASAELVERLKMLPGDEAVQAVSRLRAAAGLPPEKRRRPTFVGPDFVRRYRESPWVKIGSHSVDHQAVVAQPESSLHAQWTESRAVLEELAGQEVRHFAYPYGAPSEIGTAAPRLVTTHYDSAVTMVRGVCHEKTDLAQLPRVPLYDSDGDLRMIAKIALAPWT